MYFLLSIFIFEYKIWILKKKKKKNKKQRQKKPLTMIIWFF